MCENCFELDGEIWAAIIVVDMVLTGVVMAIVYNCTKGRSSAGFLQTQKGANIKPPTHQEEPFLHTSLVIVYSGLFSDFHAFE